MSATPYLEFANGRWSVPVPWDRVDAARAALLSEGIEAIACWEPLERKARLELPPGTDPARVSAVISSTPELLVGRDPL